MTAPRIAVLFLGFSALTLPPRIAAAYRPFDGTDADVAGVGEFELELGAGGIAGSQRSLFLVAPSTVLNFGLLRRVELVVDFRGMEALRGPEASGFRVQDTDCLLKIVLREGVLQGQGGPSIAWEVGPFTPEIGGEKGWGAQSNLIASARWGWLTAHLNAGIIINRTGSFGVVNSAILEGPLSMSVRPVMELGQAKDFRGPGSVWSLVGLLWPVSEDFVVDAAYRAAWQQDGTIAGEVRAGLTWTVDLWSKVGRQ